MEPKNICFFITHATLMNDHAEMCLLHLSKADASNFDVLYIYNTHEHELSNNSIINLTNIYGIGKIFKEIKIFPYDNRTPKRLSSDIKTIFNYCQKEYNLTDRILLLKSDIMISKCLLQEFCSNKNNIFIQTPPFICAKERCSNQEIIEYTNREYLLLSDDITFFNEDELGNRIDLNNNKNVFDEMYKFVSCTVKIDFSCHYLTVNTIPFFDFHEKDWGGVNMSRCKNFWMDTKKSFTVHKYHSILSDNCSKSREGSIETILLS